MDQQDVAPEMVKAIETQPDGAYADLAAEFNGQVLVGMAYAKAMNFIRLLGSASRVVSRDGRDQWIDKSVRVGRINLWVWQDKISKVVVE